jgi:hypothetical protein
MSFSLAYELNGTGWADARIGNGQTDLEVTVSYLHDSLKQLGELALALLKGQTKGTVSFFDEPGEHILEVSRVNNDLTFEVRWHDDWKSALEGTAKQKVVLTGATTVQEFVGAVRGQLLLVLERHGLKGYKELWVEHDFPNGVLRELQASAL